MTKFIKENGQHDNLIAIIKNLAEIIEIPLTKITIEEALQSHPDYPGLSSLQDTFRRWRLRNMVVKLDQENLSEIDAPCISTINDKGTKYIILTGLEKSKVRYLDSEYGWIKEDREVFISKWNGITLLVEKNELSGEQDYNENKESERRLKRLTSIKYTSSILLFLSLVAFVGSINLILLPTLIIKFLGLAISVLLVMKSYQPNNSLLDNICRIGNRTDERFNCNDVISSSQGKIFHWLSWAEAGVIYFVGGILILGFGIISSLPFNANLLLTISLITLPLTFFSLYAQGVLLRKWCVMCIVVQTILWLDFAILYSLAEVSYQYSLQEYLLLFISFLIPFTAWISISQLPSYIGRYTVLKQKLNRFDYNPEIKRALVAGGHKCSSITIKNEIEIPIGNDPKKEMIIVVSNSCNPCQLFLKKLKEQIIFLEDTSIKIRFVGLANNKDGSNFLNHAAQLKKHNLLDALIDWYSVRNITEWRAKWNIENLNGNEATTIEQVQKWAIENKINRTPSIIYENRLQFPGIEIMDLTTN